MNHQDDREGTDQKLAKDAEEWRDSVSKGGHGAHRPCEKFPIEEAQEKALTQNSPEPQRVASEPTPHD